MTVSKQPDDDDKLKYSAEGNPGRSLADLERENAQLRQRLTELTARASEPEEIVRAIRSGEVDALVVSELKGMRVYTLRPADLLYRLMVENMNEGAAAVALDGTLMYVNSCFCRLVGETGDRLIGRSIYSWLTEPGREFLKRVLQTPGPSQDRQEVELLGSDNQKLPVLLATSHLPNEERLDESFWTDIVGLIVTDLREQKEHEQLLTADQRKDEFLAMLGHELRNPLAAISGGVHVLKLLGTSNMDVQEMYTIIENQTAHMTHLVNDLLDVSRITRGKIVLRPKRLDMASLVREATAEYLVGVHEDVPQLTVEVPPAPVWIEGDRTRLCQVFTNLFDNARKFSNGPARIRVALAVEETTRQAVLRVRDFGIGMSPETLEAVFEPFRQAAEQGLEHSRGGLGLGLTLVRGLVQLHEGSVEAASDGLGRGSQFIVRLPLAPSEDAAPGNLPAQRTSTE